jgi:hypothetical protein
MFESANNSTAIPSFGRDEHCGQEDGVITVLEKQGKSKSDQDARDSHRADTIRTGGFPMPIHDWSRVPAGTYHFFHQRWIQDIAAALNAGGLPPGYFAMSEVDAKGPIPDVLALKAQPPMPPDAGPPGIAVLDAPPRTRVVSRGENTAGYARRADHLSVYLPQGELIAVIEIVPPGNKDSRNGLRAFVRKAGRLLRLGVHLLVVDLFRPSVRDPHGIHKAIWDQIREESFELPADKPFTLAAYSAGPEKVAYVENVGVGDPLPSMPLFLTADRYVPCPLDETYRAAWDVFPRVLKGPLEAPSA